jgi:hypothetical protein
MSDELATQQQGALAMPDYGEMANAGFENAKPSDNLIPFLTLAQPDSQIAVDGGPRRIPGVVGGNFVNTAIKAIHKTLEIVVCHVETVYVEWINRDSGGGFVAVHDYVAPEVLKAKAEATKKYKYKIGEHDLVETINLYCLRLENGRAVEPMVFPLTGSKIMPWKAFRTPISMFLGQFPVGKRPPLFAFPAILSSVLTPGKPGKKAYYTPVFTLKGPDVASTLLPPFLADGSPNMVLRAAYDVAKAIQGGTMSADKAGYEQEAPADDALTPF